jgi:hypothetical protein
MSLTQKQRMFGGARYAIAMNAMVWLTPCHAPGGG